MHCKVATCQQSAHTVVCTPKSSFSKTQQTDSNTYHKSVRFPYHTQQALLNSARRWAGKLCDNVQTFHANPFNLVSHCVVLLTLQCTYLTSQ
jgi:hypothetical protein